jgi:hypothetical protein
MEERRNALKLLDRKSEGKGNIKTDFKQMMGLYRVDLCGSG